MGGNWVRLLDCNVSSHDRKHPLLFRHRDLLSLLCNLSRKMPPLFHDILMLMVFLSLTFLSLADILPLKKMVPICLASVTDAETQAPLLSNSVVVRIVV